MTAEEMIEEIDECRGPCGKLCLSCPEGYYLQEIKDVISGLIAERDELLDKIKKYEFERNF